MKTLTNTKVTVRLRKAEDRDEWYVYIEAYPVFVEGKKQPQRVREYINRSITTPVFDKKRSARTAADGSKTFKPKRDTNGIIICKSEIDQETCIYADNIRRIRQREYDTVELYSDEDKRVLEQKQKSEANFIEYFTNLNETRNKAASEGIRKNWRLAIRVLTLFAGENLLFSDINEKFCENYRTALLTTANGSKKSGETISQNTAYSYFATFKTALHQAFLEGYFSDDIAGRVRGIKLMETRREYLTTEELNRLAATPCRNDVLKRAALFSALTGLRHSDIAKLRWVEVDDSGNTPRLNFTQQKTKGVEYKPISTQALELCGERINPEDLVFPNLPEVKVISTSLNPWLKAAGITKHITFHCFRHTFATLQLAGGTDIYTVSKMMGHTNVRTTQVYAKVVDEKKEKAANAIQIDMKPLND